MNYRDFFKNHKATAEDIRKLMPEGVDPKQFSLGIKTEKEHTSDEFVAAKIAGDHLKEDPKYYTKLLAAGLEEESDKGTDDADKLIGKMQKDKNLRPFPFDKDRTPPMRKGNEKGILPAKEEHCGACKDDMGGDETPYDDFNGGLPKLGGALAIPHRGEPIRMAKIIQVGNEFKSGKPASGEVSGMTACGAKQGVTKDTGGIPANQEGDKEPITAGGKSLDSSIATKSVGGPVTPGDGQKQGGPNSQGTIASTSKMNEHKEKVRNIVKEVLKEIRFDKSSGKWIRIDEAKHKAGCTCGFCKNKGTFGKKKDEKEDKEDVDENVDMKMGPSYKTVQPRMYKVADDDFARTNQYDPEVTEMIDEEEVVKMQERYGSLATMPRNLTEDELKEMNTLRVKLEQFDDWDPQGYDEEDPKAPEEPDTEIDPDAEEVEEGGVIGWAQFLTEPQKKALEVLERKGWRATNAFPGQPDAEGGMADETVTVVVTKKGPGRWDHKSGEVDPDGSVNGQPVDKFLAVNLQEKAPKGWEGTVKAMKKEPGIDNPWALAHWMKGKGMKSHKQEEVSECGRDATMKMGPSYRVVAPQQARTLDCDQAHRNQDTPTSTNECDRNATMKMGPSYRVVAPRQARVVDDDQAHRNQDSPDMTNEAGGMAVQHSSYRTANDAPQIPKNRHAGDIDEGEKKVSKVVKTIKKGQKPKKSIPDKLKHEVPRHTTSGVHKRKT